MCTSITVTRRCVLLSWQTNIAGSKIIAHADITMETLSLFQGISKRTAFLKDGLAKYDVRAG